MQPAVENAFGLSDEGQGEPVILLHSSLSSGRQWRKLAEHLAGRYRLLALDLLGYGDTPMPAETENFRMGREVDLVEQVFERVDQPVHLVGHSYGGAVALKTALRHPGRVKSIYAHEPVLFALLKKQHYWAEWNEIESISLTTGRFLDEGRPEKALETFVDYWSGPGAWQRVSRDRRPAFLRTIAKVPLDFQAIAADCDGPTAYEALPMPVFLTAGDVGAQTARRVTEILSQALPNASFHIVQGTGHMAPVNDADRINALIRGYLDSHVGARHPSDPWDDDSVERRRRPR